MIGELSLLSSSVFSPAPYKEYTLKYTEKEIERITALRGQNKTFPEIAAILNRTPTGVRRYAERNHITIQPDSHNYIKVAFVNDFHIPFHDKILLDLFYEFLAYFKPDKIFLIGDLLDCYSLSFFDKDPTRLGRFQDELDIANNVLNELYRLCPDIEFWEGNHEARLTRHLKKNPQLYGLRCLEWESLLFLKERKIKFHSYADPPFGFHNFRIHHGNIVRKWSGFTAKGNQEKYGGCGITGHSHRGGQFIKRNMAGWDGWWDNMCMCRLDPEWKDFPDWLQGWSVAYFTRKDLFHLEQIPVIDHKFLFHGRLFGK